MGTLRSQDEGRRSALVPSLAKDGRSSRHWGAGGRGGGGWYWLFQVGLGRSRFKVQGLGLRG